MTIDAGNTPIGNYNFFNVTGTSHGVVHKAKTYLNVISLFQINCSPSELTIPTGNSSIANCAVSTPAESAPTVTLSCDDLPAGASCSFSPPTVNPEQGAVKKSKLTLDSGTAPLGAYSIKVIGTTIAGISHGTGMTLNVVAFPDFSVDCSPSDLSIAQSTSGYIECVVISTSVFNAVVALSCSDHPTTVTCSFLPDTVQPPKGGSVGFSMIVNSGDTAVDSYALKIAGTSGDILRTTEFALDVTDEPDFSVSCSPDSVIFGPSTCTITSLNGFSAPVTLSCEDQPHTISCLFGEKTITPPSGGNISTSVSLSSPNPPQHSSFLLNVLGTSDTKVRTTSTIPSIVSFFLVPESPVGIIAIIASSLAALGGFVLWRRSKNPTDGMVGLGI